MKNGGTIKRYSAADLRERHARGESRTDLARVRAKTEEELERDIARDPDWQDVPADWYRDALAVIPPGKKLVSLRLDSDVIEWFKAQGPGYQTRMNAVLRTFMQHADKGRKTG